MLPHLKVLATLDLLMVTPVHNKKHTPRGSFCSLFIHIITETVEVGEIERTIFSGIKL